MDCIFCEITAGRSPSSKVFEDDEVLAFMTRRPTRTGEFLVIPKKHIDLFTDVPDELAAKLFLIAKRYAARAYTRLDPKPDRMGMVIHGYGVSHTHLVVLPQHDPNDITSMRFLSVEDNEIKFSENLIPICPRHELDEIAAFISRGD